MQEKCTKICFFGIYDPEYSRSRVLMRGLRENNIDVVECNVKGKGWKNYWTLYKKHRKLNGKYDLMIVGFPGQRVMWLAKLICRKKIFFDVFISQYNTYVFDRKSCSPKSFTAFKLWFLDWYSLKLADRMLSDTNEHTKYFVDTFNVDVDKFIRVFVGSDDEIMRPIKINQDQGRKEEFIVHFHGKYIPLQGVQYIVEAANLLRKENDIVFNLIGEGTDYDKVKKLVGDFKLFNVRLIKSVAYAELPLWMARGNICLGIFGCTNKTKMVVPNKVFESLAVKKPLITAETPATKEILTDRVNCLFCKTANPKDLADKILELKNDPELAQNIAENGYKLFKEKLSPKILYKELANVINSLNVR
jgi:glycosyltransferase involved in cell wall biosynthesis